VDAPATAANFNHLEMLALAVAGDIVAHDNLFLAFLVVIEQGELVLPRPVASFFPAPWPGRRSPLRPYRHLGLLTAHGVGGSVLPFEIQPGRRRVHRLRGEVRPGEPERAVIASE
jgi:hypothetical protein